MFITIDKLVQTSSLRFGRYFDKHFKVSQDLDQTIDTIQELHADFNLLQSIIHFQIDLTLPLIIYWNLFVIALKDLKHSRWCLGQLVRGILLRENNSQMLKGKILNKVIYFN